MSCGATPVVYGLCAVIAPIQQLAAQIAPIQQLRATIAPITSTIEEDVVPATIYYRVIIGTEILSKDPDPHFVAVSPVSDPAQWRIMYAEKIELPPGMRAAKLDVVLE